MAVIENKVDYWDYIAHEWKAGRSDYLWRKHSDAVNMALLSRWLPENPVRRLLKTDLFDEAVSEGLVPFLRLRANTMVGMDVSLMTLRRAQRCLQVGRIVFADVRKLPFAKESFDVVVSNSTLDHFHSIEEIRSSLQELHRVIRTGGQLLLTMDNPANPAIALRNALPFKMLYRFGVVPYYVGVTCRPRRLQRILQEVGLETLEMTAVLHCPRILAVSIARIFQAKAAPPTQNIFLSWLMECERMACWPTRFLTGNYIAARCVKRSEG
jgi:SAM-dependent methyltransferase